MCFTPLPLLPIFTQRPQCLFFCQGLKGLSFTNENSPNKPALRPTGVHTCIVFMEICSAEKLPTVLVAFSFWKQWECGYFAYQDHPVYLLQDNDSRLVGGPVLSMNFVCLPHIKYMAVLRWLGVRFHIVWSKIEESCSHSVYAGQEKVVYMHIACRHYV